jgi:hypothetical protein
MSANAAVKPDLAKAAIAACPTAVFCVTAHPTAPTVRVVAFTPGCQIGYIWITAATLILMRFGCQSRASC